MDESSGVTCNDSDKLSCNQNLSNNETSSTNMAITCREHDYSSTFEVPLETIKKEVTDEEVCIVNESPVSSSQNVTRVPVLLPTPKIGKYSQRPNHPRHPKLPKLLPKLREPPKIMFPLPRSVLPKMKLPPQIPPNIGAGQPPNCKGVLIVQDVKYCTMYVPKGDKSGTTNSPSSKTIRIPVDAQRKAAVIPPDVIASMVSPDVTTSSASLLQEANLTVENVQSISVEKVNRGRPKNVDPTFRAIVNPKNVESSVENPLLWDAQKTLCDLLPVFWFSAVEKNGLNVMLLSLGTEKAIQRRLYVSCDGAVQISVHCKPIPEYFVNRIVEKAGTKTSLTETTVRQFCERILKLIQIFRDFQICVGLEKREFREALINYKDIELDKNPYQEARYSETMRSVNCVRLVEIGKRRCVECGRSLQNHRRLMAKQRKSNDVATEGPPDSDPLWTDTTTPTKTRRLKESDRMSKRKKIGVNK